MRKRKSSQVGNTLFRFLTKKGPAFALAFNVVVPASAMAADVFSGDKLYKQHCAMCHGENGRPVMPGAADFSRGQGLMQSDLAISQIVLYGKNAMPGFKGVIREREILDIISYIRTFR